MGPRGVGGEGSKAAENDKEEEESRPISAEVGIIDAWMQHPTKSLMTSTTFQSLFRWTKTPAGVADALQDEHFFIYDAASTVSSMEQGGVKRGILCAWYGPQGPLISNEDVLEACQRFPGQFRGMASGDIRNPVQAVRDIKRYVTEHGFVGVRILPWLWERYATDRLFYPLYSECVQLGVPLCLQVGQTGPLCPSDVGRPIPYLEQVLIDFPDLVVVGGHIGVPWVEEMLFLCRKFPNLYIDTSAYTPDRYPKALVEFMRSKQGRRRVLFGSNYPMLQHAAVCEKIAGLGLDAEARQLFLKGNAERVFKLDQGNAERAFKLDQGLSKL